MESDLLQRACGYIGGHEEFGNSYIMDTFIHGTTYNHTFNTPIEPPGP
jgi:hypothetical protein